MWSENIRLHASDIWVDDRGESLLEQMPRNVKRQMRFCSSGVSVTYCAKAVKVEHLAPRGVVSDHASMRGAEYDSRPHLVMQKIKVNLECGHGALNMLNAFWI